MLPEGLRERFVETNGVRLHVVEAGPPDGELVLLLHGFPELWYGWRQQIPALAAAGYRVVVPDQRGYNTSDKPSGLPAYALDLLARDVLGLVEEAGRSQAVVVGHDWGGVVAWWLGLTHPQRLSRLAVLNVPHPAVMRRHLLRDPGQMLRSWYIFFFQLPGLPERLLARDGFALLARAVSGVREGRCTSDDLAVYRAAWAQPGSLEGMVNWYRAALRGVARPLSSRVPVETLLLWGVRDRFLGSAMAEASAARCDHVRLERFTRAGHFLQHDAAEEVNDRLLRFLGGGLAALA